MVAMTAGARLPHTDFLPVSVWILYHFHVNTDDRDLFGEFNPQLIHIFFEKKTTEMFSYITSDGNI